MKFYIPDHTGHSTEVFDRSSKAELAKAEARFMELVNGDKLTPAVKTGEGDAVVNRTFDPYADAYTFVRPMQGG